ncbi:uncharacterized protein LOC117187672 [Drosophila miranda]|uniref:uncharacterized protein LOC117187672 n=1 Tax=Drosophila miranda TaxID=7229 RepID=UPI0007E6A6C3|nr:uncharacterized protein LOC117187672 [Drosophila miranda]
MACHCKYLKKIFSSCCFCYSLRMGTLLFGCVFLTWYVYIVFGTAFMMECVFPNEYQAKGHTAPAALKTTMVFSFFGIVASSLLCIGVHNNNEMLFTPFLIFTPIWIIVHILVLILYNLVLVLILLTIVTSGVLIYAWLVVFSYYVELVYAYDEELHPGFV